MTAHIVELRTALVTDLQAASDAEVFETKFRAQARRVADKELKDLPKNGGDPLLWIMAAGDVGERASRGGLFTRDYEMHLALISQVDAVESEAVDNLVATAEGLLDYYADRVPPVTSRVALVESGFMQLYDQDRLLKANVFLSTLRLVFRGARGV